jgi:hypothetical protein
VTDQPPQPTQTHAPQNAVCSICGYNIAGVVSNDDQQVTCPECGTSLMPAPVEALFTKSKLNKLYFRQLILPSVIAGILVMMIIPIPRLGLLAFISYLLIAPVAQIILYVSVITSGLGKSRPYPRPCTRWHIPFVAAAACIPGTAIYISTIFLAGTFL